MVDAEAAANPGEQAVDSGDEGQDGKHVAEDLAGNDETEKGTLGKGMQCIHRLVRIVVATVNDYASTCHGLLHLWDTDLADGHRSWNTHDRGGDKVLSWDAQAYISAQNGAGDSGESLNGLTVR